MSDAIMRGYYRPIVDLANPRSFNIVVKRNDKGSRMVVFTLAWNGKAFDMEDVGLICVKGVKPDGKIIFQDCVVEDNKVYYLMSEQVCNVTGKVTMELEIQSKSGTIISSFEFFIIVENLLFDENDLLSDDDLSGFKSFMIRAELAAQNAEKVVEDFKKEAGDLPAIKEEYIQTLDEYAEWFEILKQMLKDGKLNGERGPQGEPGKDAVVIEGKGLLGFKIDDSGELVCVYYDQTPPPLSMNTDGELIYTY